MFNRIADHLNVPDDASTGEAAREAAAEVSARAREGLQSTLATVRAQIVQNPTRSLAIALAAGVTLGWLIKRR